MKLLTVQSRALNICTTENLTLAIYHYTVFHGGYHETIFVSYLNSVTDLVV